MISTDSAARNGETDALRVAREERNADQGQCHVEANTAIATANTNPGMDVGGDATHNQGGLCVAHNLNEEFL